MQKTLKSYFFWTHQRGSFHYDVMVTLILAFIFITPQFINYGDKTTHIPSAVDPIQVAQDGDFGLILTVPNQNVVVTLPASDKVVRRALHNAIQPVTGDAVSVVRWQTVLDASGKPAKWIVWAHR